MSVVDSLIAAITPPESEEARAEARAKAQSLARPGDWLSLILDHHRAIEAQFTTLKSTVDAETRIMEQQRLAELLTAHAIAEEAAIYPALANNHQVGHAELAYQEQSAAKMELGLLERLDPLSDDYNDKLEHIEGAVAHHVYSEEGTWFADLAERAPADEQLAMTEQYVEQYNRYLG